MSVSCLDTGLKYKYTAVAVERIRRRVSIRIVGFDFFVGGGAVVSVVVLGFEAC